MSAKFALLFSNYAGQVALRNLLRHSLRLGRRTRGESDGRERKRCWAF